MFDIGIGDILIVAVIGLLIFGPEKLPRAAADAAKWIKQIRVMATSARKDLADSAGLDLSDSVDAVKSIQELHPRRIAASLFTEDEDDSPASKKSSGGGSSASGGATSSSKPAFDPDAT